MIIKNRETKIVALKDRYKAVFSDACDYLSYLLV